MLKQVHIHDKAFEIFITSETIQKRVMEISKRITKDLAGCEPVFLCVLNGAFFFASDIMKMLDFDCEISFVKLASYQGTNSTGVVRTLIGIEENLANRHIVIIEDIIDTGLSMYELLEALKAVRPLSIKIATLIMKKDVCKYNLQVDYIGFEVENKFLVGYGLDYNKQGRHYHDIFAAL